MPATSETATSTRLVEWSPRQEPIPYELYDWAHSVALRAVFCAEGHFADYPLKPASHYREEAEEWVAKTLGRRMPQAYAERPNEALQVVDRMIEVEYIQAQTPWPKIDPADSKLSQAQQETYEQWLSRDPQAPRFLPDDILAKLLHDRSERFCRIVAACWKQIPEGHKPAMRDLVFDLMKQLDFATTVFHLLVARCEQLTGQDLEG